MKREKIIKEILESMNYWAEHMRFAYFGRYLVVNDSFYPKPFCPSMGDRMIFRQIVENRFDQIGEKYKEFKGDIEKIGRGILIEEYYPKYGEYVKITKADKRRIRMIDIEVVLEKIGKYEEKKEK